MPDREVLADLERAGIVASGQAARAVAGGSISRTVRLETNGGPVLLKLESPDGADLLAAEAESLEALRDSASVAVPAVLAQGIAGSQAYLALQWIEFRSKSPAAERRLGAELALLHRRMASDFGWHRDNYIGRTPQPNDRSDEWLAFFRDRRLRYQLGLARRNGVGGEACELGAALLADLERFFDGRSVQPSLLHGDLWGGNWGATAGGTPYLFDPASYFGDREADLAMTRLFGGFGHAFYEAYEAAWPLDAGWERRVELYNLYHLLNHFNLFGGMYRGQVVATLRGLLG